MHDIHEPPREQRYIEDVGPVALFIHGEQIEQQGRHPATVERLGNGDISRTEPARSAAMRKDDQTVRRAGQLQHPGKTKRRNVDVANIHGRFQTKLVHDTERPRRL